MKTLKEVNFLIITGSSYEDLLNDGKIEALKTIFIKDRIADKSQRTRMYFFSNTAVHKKERLSNKEKYIQRARKIGFITPRTI
jgi:hypothetical protein